MSALDLTAPDISCDHCQHTIEKGLAAVAGIESVEVTVPERLVHVQYDGERLDPAAVRASLAAIGYPPV